MKRTIAFIIVLISAFSLAGCNRSAGSDTLLSAYIGDHVTKVNIAHCIGGRSTQWVAEGQDVDSLKNWYSVSNPSDPPITEPLGEQLTLEKVKELAEKGENLSWSDFERYKDGGNIGSGLYILFYDIDEHYYLLIGGIGEQAPPMYIYLRSKTDDSVFIDIRTENIDDFINGLSG